MGMDLYGNAPSQEIGKYFRNSIWQWGPMVDYIKIVAPDEAAPCKMWCTNDADGLNQEQANRLADKLEAEIWNGRCERYMLSRGAFKIDTTDQQNIIKAAIVAIKAAGLEPPEDYIADSTWPFSVTNVKHFVTFLRTSGGFKIC